MAYIVTNLMGADHKRNTLSVPELEQLYAELQQADTEHDSVSVRGGPDCEWCLSAFRNGLLVWENVERTIIPPCHMTGVTQERVIALWAKLAIGELAAVASEAWDPGDRQLAVAARQ